MIHQGNGKCFVGFVHMFYYYMLGWKCKWGKQIFSDLISNCANAHIIAHQYQPGFQFCVARQISTGILFRQCTEISFSFSPAPLGGLERRSSCSRHLIKTLRFSRFYYSNMAHTLQAVVVAHVDRAGIFSKNTKSHYTYINNY